MPSSMRCSRPQKGSVALDAGTLTCSKPETLLLSSGVPMLAAGDEIGRTQQGNNNAYCQDNETSWVDWNITKEGEALTRFVRQLTALRHHYPILRRGRFMTGEFNEALGVKDVTWVNASGNEMKRHFVVVRLQT